MKKIATYPKLIQVRMDRECGQYKKWPAQDEQTMYSKLTIGSKEDSLPG